MKGRIIGREGRNIRALENITGVDFIIDDTPSAVVLLGFDGAPRDREAHAREARQDGRIHPARIEEAFFQARSEIENHIVEQGEQALFEANVHSMHPELVKLLGRLKFRTSYGQNVLSHSIEVSRLAAMMASELGASAKTARRAALHARHRQVGQPRGRGAARPGRRRARAPATASPKPSPTRWRHTTTRSRCRPSRP